MVISNMFSSDKSQSSVSFSAGNMGNGINSACNLINQYLLNTLLAKLCTSPFITASQKITMAYHVNVTNNLNIYKVYFKYLYSFTNFSSISGSWAELISLIKVKVTLF